ncbi:AraC family transcriptional regulator [Paenibacillus sp. 79R4]|uniref:helix-turn-helix domain-containing protein n=1 Tax=Paenibacillus sp. 79R4 TaxID=2212847 RepID=UPI0015C0F545
MIKSTSPQSPQGAIFGMPVRLLALEDLEPSTLESEGADSLRKLLAVWKGKLGIPRPDAEAGGLLWLCEGDLLILSPGDRIQVEVDPEESVEGCLLEFLITGAADSPMLGLNPLLLRQADKITETAQRITQHWRLGSRQPWELQWLFVDLMQQVEEASRMGQERSGSWLEESLNYIHAQYHNELSRERLAERAGVSPEHYSRCFRVHTGHTLTEYLTLLRVRKAQEILLSGRPVTLDQVAREVGYREGMYLSRRFKQTTGVAPTLYRKVSVRPAALNVNHSASLWALGIHPEWGVFSDWLTQAHGAQARYSPDVLLIGDCSRQFCSGRPDVFISYELERPATSLLELAPIIQLPHKRLDWQGQFRRIADLVGRSRQAEELLEQIGERADRLRGGLLQCYGTGRSVIVWEIGNNGTAYAIGASNGRGAQLLYGELGFQMPDSLLERGLLERGYVQTGISEMPEFEADLIFLTGMPRSREVALRLGTMLQSRKWCSLKAASSGNVYMLDNPELFFGYDPLSSHEQLAVLERVLLHR